MAVGVAGGFLGGLLRCLGEVLLRDGGVGVAPGQGDGGGGFVAVGV